MNLVELAQAYGLVHVIVVLSQNRKRSTRSSATTSGPWSPLST